MKRKSRKIEPEYGTNEYWRGHFDNPPGQMLVYVFNYKSGFGETDFEKLFGVLCAFMRSDYESVLRIMNMSDFGIVKDLKEAREILKQRGY